MMKKVIAIVLIVATGGTWGYLSYLNEKEIEEAKALRLAMEKARAEAAARAKALADERAQFEAQIKGELDACLANAQKTREDFLTQNQKPVRGKPGQFTVTQAIQDQANKDQETANTACQANYATRQNSGT